jgi:hypothetical protein
VSITAVQQPREKALVVCDGRLVVGAGENNFFERSAAQRRLVPAWR